MTPVAFLAALVAVAAASPVRNESSSILTIKKIPI